MFPPTLPDRFRKPTSAWRITNFFYLWKPILGLLVVITSLSCSDKRKSDPCCVFSDIADNTGLAEGQGMILVEGSTDAYFYVLKETGEQLTYQSLNKSVALEPGKYQIKVNSSIHPVEIRAGEVAKCSTGTLIIAGNTAEYYYVMDTLGHQLAYESLGKATTWFPGSYTIRVNNTEVSAEIKLKELTEIRTGTMLVRGTTNEYYYVLDDGNKQLNYNALEKPLAFLPGSYAVKVNNTTMKADVLPGKVTELATGNLLVNGLTDEYYYVTDTIGKALNYQSLNKPLAFFPGAFHIKVNNTLVKGTVSPGQTTEFPTGSLMLTGGGTGYYYVLDQTGNQLNYNSLNKSLSFFPSEYTIKLGSSTRKATVTPGQLTSISAFN